MNNLDNQKKGNGLALIPLLFFIVIFFGVGLMLNIQGVEMAFYQFPAPVAMMFALILAFIMFKQPMEQKFDSFIAGCGDSNIIMMCVIYLLAGAFSSVSKAMGGVEATVNLGLKFIPTEFIIAGIFVLSAFIATATGTSMGTVGAIAPIALGVADKAGVSVVLVISAVVCGSTFGDNLSMISDTTIAATRSQGCEMKDKFKMNFLIALPAAILTFVIFLIVGRPEQAVPLGDLSFNIVKVLPYLFVLILAIIGVNVFVVLASGVLIAGAIGFIYGDLTFMTFVQAIYGGFTGMTEIFLLSMLTGGLAKMVTAAGGIDFLINKVSLMMKGKKSAELGIMAVTALTDVAVDNNTVAIIVAGPIAKEISTKYQVDPRRSASLVDIASCSVQACLPYGAHLLLAGSLAAAAGFTVAPIEVVPMLFYQFLLAGAAIVSIFVPFADKMIKKDPWNWEYDKAQSGVDAILKEKTSVTSE